MKISVKTEVLLAKAEAYLAEVNSGRAERERKNAAYTKRWTAQVVKALREVAERMEKGEAIDEIEMAKLNGGSLYISVEKPQYQGSRDFDDWRVERDVEALKATDKAAYSIDEGDPLYRYLAQPERGR